MEEKKSIGNCPFCDAEMGVHTGWAGSPEMFARYRKEHEAGHPTTQNVLSEEKRCNCQYEKENGHALACPLYERKPFEEQCYMCHDILGTETCQYHKVSFLDPLDPASCSKCGNAFEKGRENVLGDLEKDYVKELYAAGEKAMLEKIREKLPAEQQTCGCDEDDNMEGFGYHTKDCTFYPYGWNEYRKKVLAILDSLEDSY